MAGFLLFAPTLEGQETREITEATRLRKEPQGVALVSLPAGTTVEPKRTRGNWREILIQGWIFSRSVERTTREGFDLVVTAPGGENIREAPNGAILGQVRTGTLLRKHEGRPGWIKVSRAGWVPREVVKSPSRPPSPAVEPTTPPAPSPAPNEPVESGALPTQGPAQTSVEEAPVDSEEARVSRESVIFAAPQGAPYGTLQPGAPDAGAQPLG